MQISESGTQDFAPPDGPRLVALKLSDPVALARQVAKAWAEGDAVLPLDPGAPGPVTASALARMRPAVLVSEAGAWSLPDPLPTRDDTAAVLQTSGSTGIPKGVEISHAALAASATLTHRRLGVGEGDRWVCALPLHHIAGFSMLSRSKALGNQAELLMLAPSPAVIEASSGTLISLVPTQLLRSLEDGSDLTRFKAVLLGGAAIDPRLSDRAESAGVNIVRTYGMTETCGGVVYDGAPLDDVDVHIGDSELSGAAHSDVGVISIASPTLMTGYRGSGPLRSHRFATADIGRIEDGRLIVLGRTDDIINSGGEKVVPRVVELALLAHPAVEDALVFGAPDSEWGHRVIAVVAGGSSQKENIVDSVKLTLARHEVPKEIIFVSGIPRTPGGKLDRAALGEMGGDLRF